jgi:uncharacterized membrane protein YhiD involved in acid resistance
MYGVALLGTGAIGAIMLGLSRLSSFSQKKREYVLLLAYAPNGEEEAPYLKVLKAHCRQHQLISAKSHEGVEELELSLYVHLKNEQQRDLLVQELRQVDGVRNANLFFDEEYY